MDGLDKVLRDFSNYITNLVDVGGPTETEYEELNLRFQKIYPYFSDPQTGLVVSEFWPLFKDAFSVNTMQGFVVKKPHGYAGDFEIIDRIHTNWISHLPHLVNWDHFFHWQEAPKAVRNRKDFFKNLLSKFESENHDSYSVLNVGSGPTRDVMEYMGSKPDSKLLIDCLDMDKNAISYAKKLVTHKNINFICKNAFRITGDKTYNLVWSAGLFDYLDEKQFVYLLRRLYDITNFGGKVVIGNFSEKNTSREYMEFGEWFLRHRPADLLFDLAKQAGYPPSCIEVTGEPTGVNLFLTVVKV